jgi:hypothetical protein
MNIAYDRPDLVLRHKTTCQEARVHVNYIRLGIESFSVSLYLKTTICMYQYVNVLVDSLQIHYFLTLRYSLKSFVLGKVAS